MAGPRAKAFSLKPPSKGVHAHGCVACKGRFEDACDDPKGWIKCANCITGKDVRNPLLMANRLPIACCLQLARPVRKEERQSYRLFQDCPWFICPECARTFSFSNPNRNYNPKGGK